jgi:hypothetical protein
MKACFLIVCFLNTNLSLSHKNVQKNIKMMTQYIYIYIYIYIYMIEGKNNVRKSCKYP